MRKLKEQYPYVQKQGFLMPFVPIKLINKNLTLDVMALIDSGSTVNVVPYQVGLALGGVWDDKIANFTLTGNLSSHPSCPLILKGVIGIFQPLVLGFAWSKRNDAPIILGNINFFDHFDVSFYRKSKFFELTQY